MPTRPSSAGVLAGTGAGYRSGRYPSSGQRDGSTAEPHDVRRGYGWGRPAGAGMYQRRWLALCQGMGVNGGAARAVVSPRRGDGAHDGVDMPAALCLRLVRRAGEIHRAGLKSYGVLIAKPGSPGYPFTATDVVFLDSRKNRRNDPGYRAAFRAQGDYFRQFDDAGFVADPAELLAVYRAIEDSGAQIVAPFHSHRRQPAN